MQTGLPFPDISPELFSLTLFGMTFALRWYALAYIVGILVGWRIVLAAIKKPILWADERPPFDKIAFEDLLTWIVFGIIIGGRLGYVLFYNPSHFIANPIQIPMVWQGGMSFHGGFLGVVGAIYLFCRRRGIALATTADTIAMAVPPALMLGRISNFINAELWGRPTTLPWGVAFPGQAAQSCVGLDPTVLCARHPSQLYEAGLEGLLLGAILLLLAFRWNGLKRPWLLTGMFFAGYGIARFIVEFVRQPDMQFVSQGNPLGLYLQTGGYGLTMGQFLSVPMILIGLWLIARARR